MTQEMVDAAAPSAFYEGRVDADAVVAYAMATNDANARYTRGAGVPPLFTTTLILAASWGQGIGDDARNSVRGARGEVHGEHDVYYWGVVRPGMALKWQAATHSVKQTRGGVLVTQRILVTDSNGAPLVEHLWSNFHMGGTVAADFGADPVDHTFPEGARSRPVGSRTIAVDRDQAFRYAGVSGDHAGHALDDEIARAEGHPGKILQGMCTFGICSGAVVDVGAGGDATRLRRLAGRFSAPAFPGRDLAVDVYDVGRSADGGPVLAFEATQDGVTVIKHGRAELSAA